MAAPTCMPEAQVKAIEAANKKVAEDNAKPKKDNGLPKWVLEIVQNADKIGAGIGAATGKGAPTTGGYVPPIVMPDRPQNEGVPKYVWYIVGGVIALIVVAVILKSRGRVA